MLRDAPSGLFTLKYTLGSIRDYWRALGRVCKWEKLEEGFFVAF